MKKYMKNKGFITEKFYNRIELNKNKTENKVFTLLLLINLILIPITTKSIGEVKEKYTENKSNIYYSEENKINSNDINKWIKSIIKDEIEEAYITNKNGEVIVNNLERIDEISSDTSINISDINVDGSGKYKLGVRLNE
ncbi:hypothetical protein DIC82_15975 [Clostridium beijerinckii]|nr:hypothetical protein DIC82_15975 [Clostridium beijerinckii]